MHFPQTPIGGLHHVTAICGDPRENFHFYTEVLGLRMVKKTVNFDDPNVYHLYYGDGAGSPGTILTFFPWQGLPKGRNGAGQPQTTAFCLQAKSLPYWKDRLAEAKVPLSEPVERFNGEQVSTFRDPDGLELELVVSAALPHWVPWDQSPVPVEHQLRGFHSVTLAESGFERTHFLLVEQMGWSLSHEGNGRFRYRSPEGPESGRVDILCKPTLRPAIGGNGTVHHIAFRVKDDPGQKNWRKWIVDQGYNVSPVMDRNYFRSIYFREPGGVLFEIATDPPGFTVDEPLETLGRDLKLPPQYESLRDTLIQTLPPLG